ncbi:hypothetical protein QYM36_012093 [Artemia franciscana]|uniref:Uncharacterized protein n=1 Tax=Artemia franciscana TaxID=6661 RepID=A0AA88HN99_ARTSF|nr:hypothetical protein QYM36_012093 [Artemia franciscana]
MDDDSTDEVDGPGVDYVSIYIDVPNFDGYDTKDKKMSEFSTNEEKNDTPGSNGEVVLAEPVKKTSAPSRIAAPASISGAPPSGQVSSSRTSVSRRSQMSSSELSNQKHSISERELKSNFNEVKSAMSEMKATFESSGGGGMAMATSAPTGSAMAKLANCGLLNRGGSENYDVIPSLDGETCPGNVPKSMKYQHSSSSSSQTKYMSNSGYSSEEAVANHSQKKTFQSDGLRYEEKSAEAAMKARIELDGLKAEKMAAMKQVAIANCCGTVPHIAELYHALWNFAKRLAPGDVPQAVKSGQPLA